MANRSQGVGDSVGRVDGPDKTTGRGRYVIDAALPGMLWCRILRSPYSHARVVKIDASRALALPGVHAVLTGEDVRGLRTGNLREDEPLLSSWDRVRFIGDKVAAIAADDEDIAQQALDLIEADYEPLPAVFDASEAAQADAPVIHPEFNTYRRVEAMKTPVNVWERVTHGWGDVAQGFGAADLIMEGTYRTPKNHQMYLEPHTCLVSIDEDERVQVWVTSQAPTAKRVSLARLMGVPRDRIKINVAYLGGSFGGKGDATGVVLCYLLAKKTGRPVKFAMDYSEELAAMNPRHAAVIAIRAGVRKDGIITAWEATGTFETGAYAGYAPSGLLGPATVEPYAIENVRITSQSVYTNVVPSGYFRGPGQFQGSFASESHLDVVARGLGMSPVDIRLANVRRASSQTALGHETSADPRWPARLEETIRVAVGRSGYYDLKPAHVGRGIAVAMAGTGGMDGHAEIHLFGSGRIVAHMPTSDPGVGLATVLTQVVAEELGVPMSRVRVEPWSTDDSPNDGGFGGSRGSRVTTVAGYQAAQDLKVKLARLAAEFFGWNEERISFQRGRLVDDVTGQSKRIEEIAERLGSTMIGRADTYEADGEGIPSFAVHVAEVEVDPETGAPTVRRYTAVHETGRVLNPIGFAAQIEGGLIMGLGHALTEELSIDRSDGRVTNPSLADYKLPTARDIPPLDTFVLESDAGHGPYRVRAIGDIPINAPAPAIANAIDDAVGVRLTDLPAT
ncbi:MAG: xanthine dehydrogenase family protein molybdopterin-binding subunit, partial [Chloroflexi bacterium]|nr:xanthine dehydrogenase family protein molybdopterin-binding subunit [Chloroflexota bacterium]